MYISISIGVEPRIPSLTSLEVGRKDLALNVMEGVWAVGLDPCFAMSVVCESNHAAIHSGGMSSSGESSKKEKDYGGGYHASSITKRQKELAMEK